MRGRSCPASASERSSPARLWRGARRVAEAQREPMPLQRQVLGDGDRLTHGRHRTVRGVSLAITSSLCNHPLMAQPSESTSIFTVHASRAPSTLPPTPPPSGPRSSSLRPSRGTPHLASCCETGTVSAALPSGAAPPASAGSDHRAAVTLAERLRRTPDQQHTARVPRPRGRAGRATPAPHPDRVLRLAPGRHDRPAAASAGRTRSARRGAHRSRTPGARSYPVRRRRRSRCARERASRLVRPASSAHCIASRNSSGVVARAIGG